MIRRLIKDYPFFYNLYFYLYLRGVKKQRKIPYFNKSTQLYFGAYPRSGNTFLNHLVRNIMPELKSVHHLHSLAVVKISLRKKLPTFVLIRKPEECVSSAYIKRLALKNNGTPPEKIDVNILKLFLNDYYAYYKYVDKVKADVNVIDFDEFIKCPEKVIAEMAKKMDYKLEKADLPRQVQQATSTYKSNTSKYGNSKPSEAKEREKQKVKNKLNTLQEFKDCNELYKRILSSI